MLASMPPAQLASTLDQARTYLQLESDISRKLSRQYAGQPRRVSNAPPPFKSPKGGFSVHVQEHDFEGVRFALARFGEDPDKVLAAFWKENNGGGDFEVVPLFSHGAAPRTELCSQRSLAAALQTASIEPGSRTEQQWKAVCEAHCVAWPTRLKPKPKAA